jgi:hypothetical protein
MLSTSAAVPWQHGRSTADSTGAFQHGIPVRFSHHDRFGTLRRFRVCHHACLNCLLSPGCVTGMFSSGFEQRLCTQTPDKGGLLLRHSGHRILNRREAARSRSARAKAAYGGRPGSRAPDLVSSRGGRT